MKDNLLKTGPHEHVFIMIRQRGHGQLGRQAAGMAPRRGRARRRLGRATSTIGFPLVVAPPQPQGQFTMAGPGEVAAVGGGIVMVFPGGEDGNEDTDGEGRMGRADQDDGRGERFPYGIGWVARGEMMEHGRDLGLQMEPCPLQAAQPTGQAGPAGGQPRACNPTSQRLPPPCPRLARLG